MRIAYFTTDEVHAAQAGSLAARRKIDLVLGSERGPLGPTRVDASIYDIDYLSTEFVTLLMQALAGGAIQHTVVVHGYAIPADVRKALRKHGAATARKLSRHMFARIRRVVRRRQHARGDATAAGKRMRSAHVAC